MEIQDMIPITESFPEHGVLFTVRNCDDRSGYVCLIIDYFTGETLKKWYGSTVEKTLNDAQKSFFANPVFQSLMVDIQLAALN